MPQPARSPNETGADERPDKRRGKRNARRTLCWNAPVAWRLTFSPRMPR
ncbi:hypothetical protein [Streptomyces sp. BK79]